MARFVERPLSEAAAQERDADPYEFARTVALRLLDAAPRSRHQLGERLARRGVEPDVAERVLDRFEEVGLLDDAAYARMLVSSRRSSRGLAPRALALELRRAGIDDEIAATALADLAEEQVESDDEIAERLVRRRLRSMRGIDDDVAVRRLVGMLARKGYAPSFAARLAREILREERDLGDDGSTESSEVAYRRHP